MEENENTSDDLNSNSELDMEMYIEDQILEQEERKEEDENTNDDFDKQDIMGEIEMVYGKRET